ncbi:Uncharacterized protein APZ42_025152 [Daphnia magna]|uniref:Uncharacterized protein n=1 Tax=Daphnia magna TaxID=35525 RepID=A0A164TE68_9CRUS|nr:Uncharacterized protein APZ42_025152 [Daphnia magna]
MLANVPITVNQPPLERSRVSKLKRSRFHLICSCPNILSEHRSKVLQLVNLYGVAVNEHGVSQPVTVIPTHQLLKVASSLPPQSLRTASTSFDLLVEYIEPVTPKKTVISHFDKQAAEQSQNEGVDQMPNVLQPMAQVAQELIQPTMESLDDEQADQPPQNEDGQIPYVQQPMALVIEELIQPTMESLVDEQQPTLVNFTDYETFGWNIQFQGSQEWTWSFTNSLLLCTTNHLSSPWPQFAARDRQLNRE